VGLSDSPVKFRRILEMLRVLRDLVRHAGVQDDLVGYLQALYGYNPSERARNLMEVYDRCYQERDCGDADRVAAHQAEFLEAIADEIAWFERREASHLQARGAEDSEPVRRNAQHAAQSRPRSALLRAHGEGICREMEAAEGVSCDPRGRRQRATDRPPTGGPSAGITRRRRAYRRRGRRRFRLRNWPRIGARVGRSRHIGDLILTNEAGMFFDIRHFHFWNSGKAGMFLKTKMVKRRKPEC